MIIPNPPGNTFYIGADGFDAFYDAAGYLWFADDFRSPGQPFQAKLYRMKNGIQEQIPMAEPINGAIRLNWTPLGLSVSGSYQESEGAPVTARFFMVPEFVNFTDGVVVPPIVVTPPPTTTVDQQARDMATAAQSTANTALSTAKSANSTATNAKNIANEALASANSKPTIDIVWNKINDRLFALISAIETGNRADALDAKWQDVLFKKTNDWIYGWMKDHGFIK